MVRTSKHASMSVFLGWGLAFVGMLTGLPVSAQSYQTSFSEVKYDRARTPATLNGAVSIDIPTGSASINIPLGPGIGARGATFGPVLSGRFSPQARVNVEKAHWLPGPCRFELFMYTYDRILSGGDPNYWEQHIGQVIFSSSGGASLHPGQLTLPYRIEAGPAGQGSFEVMGHGGASFLGQVPVSVDPTAALGTLAAFGITNNGIAKKPYRIGENGSPSASANLLDITTSGDLVIGFKTENAEPAEWVQYRPDRSGGTKVVFPCKVAVVRQDTAFIFEYFQPLYKSMSEFYAHMGNEFVPLVSGGYRLREIRNRFNESIRLTYTSNGQAPEPGNGTDYRAEWFRKGISTGLAFTISLDPGPGAFPAEATALGRSYNPSAPGNDVVLGASLLRVAYEGAANAASWEIHTSTVDGHRLRSNDPAKFQLLMRDEPWDVDLANLQPFKVVQSEGQSTQTLDFIYSRFAAQSSDWLTPVYPTVLSRVESSSGEYCQLWWEPYLYRLNWAPFPGGMEDLQDSRIPGIAWGVTSDCGTHPTSYRRLVPQMNWASNVVSPGPELPICTDTRFQVAVMHPDKHVTFHRFLAAGKFQDPDFTVRMKNMIAAKHNEIETRTYAQGVIGDLADLDEEASKTPATSLAYQWVVKDRFSLRSRQNPTGVDPSLGCLPSHTRTRTWDKDTGVLTQQERREWDGMDTWKVARTCTSIATVPTLAMDILQSDGTTHQDAEGVVKHDQQVQTTYEHLPLVWLWDRPLTEAPKLWRDSTGAYFDPNGRGAEWCAPVTTRTFHATNNRLESIAQGDLTTTFSYTSDSALPDQASLVSTAPGTGAPKCVSVSYGYDDKGYLSRIIQGTLEQTQVNDAFGRPTSRTDAAGFTTGYSWDGVGRLAQISPPDSETPTSYAYNPSARTTTITRGSQQTVLVYNSEGRLALERRYGPGARPSYRVFGYDAGGRKTGETVWQTGEGVGKESEWALPNLVDTVDVQTSPGYERCVKWGFEDDGTRVCIQTRVVPPTYETAAAKYKGTLVKYDARGRVSETYNPNGVYTTTTYDGLKTTSITAPATPATPTRPARTALLDTRGKGIQTTFEKDALGRLIKVTDAWGQVTNYAFDALGKPSKVLQSDPAAPTLFQNRIWSHDDQGRLTSLFQPESGLTTYSNFNVLGKPSLASYAGREVITSFDNYGRVTSVAPVDSSVNQVFQYGTSGSGSGKLRLATSTTPSGVVTRELFYDGLGGRLSRLVRTVDGQSFVQAFGYNADGNLVSRKLPSHTAPASVGLNQAVTFDPATGLPITSLYEAMASTFTYDSVHWGLTSISSGFSTKAVSSVFNYRDDQTSLLTQQTILQGQLNRLWTYGYDDADRLTSVVGVDTQNVSALSQDEDRFVYDALGRLTGSFGRDPFDRTSGYANRGIGQGFGYDTFGNRIFSSIKALGFWAANSEPAWTGDSKGIPTPTSAMSPTPTLRAGLEKVTANTIFNAADPALSKNQMPAFMSNNAETGAQYDPQGNLVTVYTTPSAPSTQVSLTYDALARVSKVVSMAGTEEYLHDDEGLRIKVVDSTGKIRYNIYNESRQLVAQYEKVGTGPLTWKKDIIYVGTKEIAEVSPTGTSVTLTDHLGSPRFIWDGTTITQQKFLPFGEQLTDPTSMGKFAKGFTNHEQTDASGLIYMQARFYLPMWGRFASPDPARDQHFEETQSWNIYSYVRNNPVMMTDPTGMQTAPNRVKSMTDEEARRILNPSTQPNTFTAPPTPQIGSSATPAPTPAAPSPQPSAPQPSAVAGGPAADAPGTISATPASSTGVRSPDFFTLSVGVGEGGFLSGGLVFDRNCNLYLTGGVGLGVAAPLPVAASLTGGWLNQPGKPSEQQLKSAIMGKSTEISGGVFGGSGAVMSTGGPRIVNAGLYTPQVGATITTTRQITIMPAYKDPKEFTMIGRNF